MDEREDLVDGKELARQAEITTAQLKELVEEGLIVAEHEHGGAVYTVRDVAVARQCGVLIAYGLEPRHLRSVRHTAERHGELMRQMTAALRRNHSPDARRRVAETLSGTAEALGKLSALMLAGELRSILHQD